MRNLIGPLFLLVSCLLFSVTGTLQQLAPEGHTPVVITEVRMLLGSLTILAWCLLNHRLPSNWSAVPWKPMLIAVASVLLYQLLFFYSVAEVGVAVGSVVAIATTPLWAAVVAFLLFKKTPSKFWVAATYLEACVVFASMYHRSPVGLKYYGIEQVEEKTAHFLQEVAWNTVCEYFGWKK